jgi:hypothetical protein
MMTLFSGNFSKRVCLRELHRKLCQRPSVCQEWKSVGARAGRLTDTSRCGLDVESAVAIMVNVTHHWGKAAGLCAGGVRPAGAPAVTL